MKDEHGVAEYDGNYLKSRQSDRTFHGQKEINLHA
jgi:hypothetical protein